jgi:CRP-like cAMP-binding protein
MSPAARLPAVDELVETPDENGSSPRLDERQLAVLRRAGRRRVTAAGDVLVRGGVTDWDFVVVLEGLVAVVEDLEGADGGPRVVSVVGPSRFLGGLNMLAGQRAVRSVVVARPGAVVTLSVDRLRAVMVADREVADLIMRAFLLRRAMLIGRASELRVLGDRRWPASAALLATLHEQGITHIWLDPADDPAARTMLDELDVAGEQPVVVARDGRVLVGPTPEELARATGRTAVR